MAGTFYGVGVGPGDPELLTVKAVRLIQEADVIIAPHTEKKDESTALAIARPYLKDTARILYLVFPMIFQPGALSAAWESNKETILGLLAGDKNVVFLTLGDPMLYSTYIYLHRLLKDCGYPLVTVPGIPSFCAAAAATGTPLAEGEEVLSIVPATLETEKLCRVMETADNLVFLKASHSWPRIAQIIDKSEVEQAVLVTKCGSPEEEVCYDLADWQDRKINYLSTILAKKGQKGKKIGHDQ